jgi:hypothetical protein
VDFVRYATGQFMSAGKIDYEFGLLRGFTESYETLPALVQCSQLRSIAESFKENMKRVRAFCAIPVELIFWGSATTQLAVEARHAFRPPRIVDDAETLYRRQQLFHAWNAARQSRTLEEQQDEVWTVGSHNLAEMLAVETGDELANGIEAVLSAAIMGAWSAFEILAGDLWIEAVNVCPTILARNFGPKQITLKELSNFDYNVSRQVGRLLVDTGKVEFYSLKTTQRAYAASFDTGERKVSDNLFSPFPVLDGIGNVRHCFAHRAGRADQRAIDAIRRVPGLEHTDIGDRIRLTGPIVRDSINLTVERSVSLVRFVDEWLREHADECDGRSP